MSSRLLHRLQTFLRGNPWDRLLHQMQAQRARRFLLFWNRGLGDIALGLYQVIAEIHEHCPGAQISVLTRADLADAFKLLDVARVLIDPELQRGEKDAAQHSFARLHIQGSDYDLVLNQINPTLWFAERRRQPQLRWPEELDQLSEKFAAHFMGQPGRTRTIGAHVQSETGQFYGYRKDWPVASWQALFARLAEQYNVRFILFGHRSDQVFDSTHCIDLRGQTTFLEMMALIKNRCNVLIAPDSGVLTMSYYLATDFPITLISLWADPRQGILKQGTASPNASLHHVPLLGRDEQVANISVNEVLDAVLHAAGAALRAGQ